MGGGESKEYTDEIGSLGVRNRTTWDAKQNLFYQRQMKRNKKLQMVPTDGSPKRIDASKKFGLRHARMSTDSPPVSYPRTEGKKTGILGG